VEHAFLDRLRQVAFAATSLAAIAVVGDAGPAVPAATRVAIERWPLPDAAAAGCAAAAIRPGDPLAILYTSGTTGPAKGVVVPHSQYAAWGLNTARILGVGAGDVLGTTLPLFHINALNTVAQAVVSGAEAVFETRFSAS